MSKVKEKIKEKNIAPVSQYKNNNQIINLSDLETTDKSNTNSINTIAVRKPTKQEFIRVHPRYNLKTYVLRVDIENQIYLVNRAYWKDLSSELIHMMLVPAITPYKTMMVWPIRLPNNDGSIDNYSRSAFQASEVAKETWVRVTANSFSKTYETVPAVSKIDDPEWPSLTLEDIISRAFRPFYIEDLNHHAIRQLTGEDFK